MGARVRVQHYNLGSADSYMGSSLHDLNSVDGPTRDIEGIGGGDSLDNDRDSSSAVCNKFLKFGRNCWFHMFRLKFLVCVVMRVTEKLCAIVIYSFLILGVYGLA